MVDAEAIYESVQEYTMTPAVRVIALAEAVERIVREGVPGALVECGVWRGGSVMAMALTLMELGEERDLWLYDTFAGMPPPENIDGKMAARKWAAAGDDWCFCPIEEVEENVLSTGYPPGRFRFVEGVVEKTLPDVCPQRLALLRLDTDWYSSTSHALKHLYPRLAQGGVLIVDDYGHYQGSKRAVDRFRRAYVPDLILHPIDKACRIAYKGVTESV